jgi:hypothetical protein
VVCALTGIAGGSCLFVYLDHSFRRKNEGKYIKAENSENFNFSKKIETLSFFQQMRNE